MRCKPIKIVGVVLFGAVAIAGFGYVFMLLWNWLIPELFAGPVINYWQGLGLIVLSKILLGKPGGRGRCCGKGGGWKNQWKQKFENMTEEQRAEFKNRMKAKFCSTKQDSTCE